MTRPPFVISIQSQVVFGHVGNSAALFPMQAAGLEVAAIADLDIVNRGFGPLLLPRLAASLFQSEPRCKRIMFDRADAFVALPGGIGTLEELVEVLTWGQLGRHRKPVALADINGFWRPLVTLLEHMREEAFIRPGFEIAYHVCPTVALYDEVQVVSGGHLSGTWEVTARKRATHVSEA